MNDELLRPDAAKGVVRKDTHGIGIEDPTEELALLVWLHMLRAGVVPIPSVSPPAVQEPKS